MLSVNGKNAVKKNEVVFQQGDTVTQIGVVLSGKVLMQNEWSTFVRGQGSVIGLNDIPRGSYTASYTAQEDAVIYALAVTGKDSLKKIIEKSLDYRAIIISSQFKYIAMLAGIRRDLYNRAYRFSQFGQKSYRVYGALCQAMGIQELILKEMEELSPYGELSDENADRLIYYEEAAKIPLSVNKQYFSYSTDMALCQIMETVNIVDSFYDECSAMADYIRELLDIIGLRADSNLFEYACVQGSQMRRNGDVPYEMQGLLNDMVREIRFQYTALQKQGLKLPEADFALMEQKVADIVSEEMTESEKKTREEKDAVRKRDVLSLKDSMKQIIEYAALAQEKAQKLQDNVDYLVKASDRMSAEDDVKKAKKAITPIVFDLYFACYQKAAEEQMRMPKAVELFLNFGMLDERLLEQEHLELLCSIEPEENEGPCNVFTMVEWLNMIHEGKREPSKSEFDEDYFENLRSMKKMGDITEAEQKAFANNMDKRVEYEIMNMQKSNSRTLYGQPTTYMPILYKEAIYGYLDKILVTKKMINEGVQNLMKIDYSVFYREVLYSNTALKINHEATMQNIYPDIILFPLYGINASMWQEVGGKNKATPGRFAFPILSNTSVEDMLVKVFGRFRWELCRCIQGMQWNDVKVKSLTSEYMDYIQFYRKNRELSDEAKEKIKLQIQKGRNNSREIFLLDYEAWIKSESNGSMKMNKVAREILATYCPFAKPLREKLIVQRPYEVAMARHGRNSQKKKQEFDLRIRAIQKETSDVPEEIMTTYKFYADL